MSEALKRLAAAHDIECAYVSETGEHRDASDAAMRAVLAAMGVAAASDEDVEASLAALDGSRAPEAHGDFARCFLPEWLGDGRCWGVTCQVYALQSQRNHGIGDFEDLARLAELVGRRGGDFIGVNPLHALFSAEPARYSPYSPSSREFLNPLYIALDRVDGFDAEAYPGGDAIADARGAAQVDYETVANFKLGVLENLFAAFEQPGRGGDDIHAARRRAFEDFLAARGDALHGFALFETLCEHVVAGGGPSGWHGWPEDLIAPDGEAVRSLADEKGDRIRFHAWLQWLADEQMGEVQARALAAGMRIGIYLDLAVGVAPDGAATWVDRAAVVPGARIGSPPDWFNDAGQDWGLAPLAPAARGGGGGGQGPFAAAIESVMRHAGAIRIDHAMALERLYWIPQHHDARDGAYVRYPTAELVGQLADLSHRFRAIVIGEDLGTVPPGFRDMMRRAEIQAYRVFHFERHMDRHYLEPDAYPREALACLATHDMPTLRGWWHGSDIDLRRDLGISGEESTARQYEERRHDRRLVLSLLADRGLLPDAFAAAAQGSEEPPDDLPDPIMSAIHALLAQASSRLFAVQLEDLTGAVAQVNLPGTTDAYPNWRSKLPLALEDLEASPLFQDIVERVAATRPRAG